MCGTLLTYLALYKTTALLLRASSVYPHRRYTELAGTRSQAVEPVSKGESRHRLYLFEISLGSPLPLLTVLAGVRV